MGGGSGGGSLVLPIFPDSPYSLRQGPPKNIPRAYQEYRLFVYFLYTLGILLV